VLQGGRGCDLRAAEPAHVLDVSLERARFPGHPGHLEAEHQRGRERPRLRRDVADVGDLDPGFFADLGAAYNAAVRDFAAAGCRYLQLDEVNIAYLCDPEQIEQLGARGEKVEGLLETYAGMINGAIATTGVVCNSTA